MDVQGSQYHLLNGRADFGRCADTTPVTGSGLTLAEVWATESVGLPSSIPTTWEYDPDMDALRLRRDTPLFRRAGRGAPLQPADRRGAGRDGYGNWYWIGADEHSIHTQADGARTGRPWWSVDDLAGPCGNPASVTFQDECDCPTYDLVLRGLCVTQHHYLLVGYRATAATEVGLLAFDLHGGGPPLRLLWPDPASFDPWDLADTDDGGALILDRTHGAYWRLDEHLRVRGTVAQTPSLFEPMSGPPTVLLPGPARPAPRFLVDDHGQPIHPIAVEPGPGGSVLALDADPGRGYSVLYCYDDDVLRWQRPLRDVVEVVEENDPTGTPMTYSVLAHDFAYLAAGGPLDPPLLYLADSEGDQAIAFTVDPDSGVVIARDEFLPIRRWGARALVRTVDGLFYDFDPTYHDDTGTRWVPVQMFTQCRFAASATLTTAADFGTLPGLDGDSFDSTVPACVWHRIFLDAHTPTGTSITLRARAADDADMLLQEPWLPQPVPYLRSAGSELPWADPWADVRGDPRAPRPLPDGMGTHELLLQQVTGRYLQLEVTFSGGGRATPLLRSLRAWYPRFSYVDHYLPAVYAENDQPTRFLERFLANFEGSYTALEERIEHSHLILDARTARAADLPWLASWFALVLDPLWDEQRRRFLVRHIDRFYRMRGTVRGLVATLRVYLDPVVDEGVFCADGSGVRVVERFLTRDTGGDAYGAPAHAPDPDPYTRVRLNSGRFDVLIPAGLSADQRAMVERIVENAKPAHTAFTMRQYEELFVVGQARLGIDTEIGTAPVFVPTIPGRPEAALLAGTYLGYPHPFDLTDRMVSDRDRAGSAPAL